MKHTFGIVLATLLMLQVVDVKAQESSLQFGVKAGLNLSNASIENSEADPKVKAGYQVGVFVDYYFTNAILLQSGLTFTTKGSDIKNLYAGHVVGGTGKDGDKFTYNQLYMQLPLYGGYRIGLSDDIGLLFKAGPYFAYGVGGKTKWKLAKSVFGDGTTSRKWDTFGDDEYDGLKKFDIGIGFGVNAEFKKMLVGIDCEFGLRDIASYLEEKYKNQNVSFTVGYKF